MADVNVYAHIYVGVCDDAYTCMSLYVCWHMYMYVIMYEVT